MYLDSIINKGKSLFGMSEKALYFYKTYLREGKMSRLVSCRYVWVCLLLVMFHASSYADEKIINLPHVDLSSGALNYSIPIDVPPGRNGMQPNLALSYNSNRRNGWVGVGWDLSVSAVQRNTKHGVDYEDDDFLFNGIELVVIVPGQEYQVEIENEFNRILKLPASDGRIYWEVTDKTGKKYLYGQVEESRQDDPDNPDRIFKWCLDKIIDSYGNYIEYSYVKDHGQIYLDQIDYSKKENEENFNNTYIKFNYEDRSDKEIYFLSNFRVETSLRIKELEFYCVDNKIKEIEFIYDSDLSDSEYQYSTGNGRSLLGRLMIYGDDGLNRLPSTDFSYLNDANGGFSSSIQTSPTSSSFTFLWNMRVGDFNGDGKDDQVIILDDENGWRVNCALGKGDGTFTSRIYTSLSTANFSSNWVMQVGDFNGDGKTDLAAILADSSGWRVNCALSNGDGTFTSRIYTSMSTSSFSSSWAIRVGDFNGDGKTDLAAILADSSGWRVNCALSNGDGTFTSRIYTSMSTSSFSSSWAIRVGDFNGDGKTDLAAILADSSGWRVNCALSNGDGTFASRIYTSMSTSSFSSSWAIRVGDFNGDGKTDLAAILADSSGWRVNCALSNGDGTFTSRIYTSMSTSSLSSLWEMLIGDFNGDGKTDLATTFADRSGWRVHCALSNGDGTFTPGIYTFLSSADFSGNSLAGTMLSIEWDMLVGDFSGNGKIDISVSSADLWNGWRIYCALSKGEATHLLQQIHHGTNAITTIEYTPSTTYNNMLLPYPIQTVSSIATDDKNGTSSTTTYEFSGGFHHIGERDFRGFNYSKVTGPQGANDERTVSETWFHQGNDVAVDVNDPYVDDGYMKGKPYRKTVKDENGNLLSETTTIYTDDDDGFAPFFTPLAQVDSSVCDGNDCGLQTRSAYEFDVYGNLVTEQRYGDISTDADDSTLVKEYAINESSHILALLAKETLYDGQGSKKSQVDYYYDGPSDCSSPATSQTPVKGSLSRIVRWLDVKTSGTPADAEARMGYDAYGNLICSVDANGNKTTNIYDSTNTFLVKGIDPLLNETLTSYYGVDGVATDKGLYGQVKTVTDPNGASTTTEYDTFGRKVLETLSDGSWQSWAYNDFGTVGSQHVYSTNSFGLWSETYFDGLGRTYKERSLAADGKVAVTLTEYDARGQTIRSSLPHFEEEDVYYISTQFDAAGRPVLVTKPDGANGQFCYDDGVTVAIDANQHRRRETRDAFGQLVKVEEYSGTYASCTTDVDTPYATTSYSYDILGNLRFVVDAKGNQTEMRYDSLGRKTYMDDPDMGIWQYDYDAKGNLLTQQDAKGQVVSFQYDALDRMAVKDYADPAETDVNYFYDESGHGFATGKLTRMMDGSGSTLYSYNDPLDRSVTMTKTIDGGSYSITTTTDALGRTDSVQYPDGKVAGYVYQYGMLQQVIYDGTVQAAYSGYNAQGQMSKITYANGVTTDYAYESDTSFLWSIKVKREETSLLDSEYLYDNKGNISNIYNYADMTKSQTFGYDALDRLVSADSPSYGSLVYSYDEIGNIVTKDGLVYTPDATRPHAVASITGGRNFGYDANGNMLSDGLRTYAWTPDNKPSSISYDGSTTSFVYDGTGQRVKKTGPSGTILYISQLYEVSGGTPVKYIFANGKRLALVRDVATPLDVLFYHQDHLGSTGLVTDTSGNKVEDIFYKPFGESVSDSGTISVNHKYTGQELDHETGLYNYNARLYDPVVGKFVSPDTFIPQPDLPQAFNRFAYCVNNPIIYSDPSGHVFGAIVAAVASVISKITVAHVAQGAIIGAMIGGATAAVTGGDIGLGLLTGAVTGAFFAGAGDIVHGVNGLSDLIA